MPKYISDLPSGTLSTTSQLEMQNGSDGQKFTGQDLLDFVEANLPSGIASIQTGYVLATSLSTSTGQDLRYTDITISSVNTAKAVVFFDGGGIGNPYSANNVPSFYAGNTAGVNHIVLPRLTSATNLRVSAPASAPAAASTIGGRYTVVEYL